MRLFIVLWAACLAVSDVCASPWGAGMPKELLDVFERHRVDPSNLKSLDLAAQADHVLGLTPAGEIHTTSLGPMELEAWIIARRSPRRPVSSEGPPRNFPGLNFSLELTPQSLAAFFDGSAAVLPSFGIPEQKPVDPWREPAFDDSWKKIANDLWNAKTARRGLNGLSHRMRADKHSETGLSHDFPEGLRLLTAAIHDGKGGPEAPAELRRKLALAASLTPEQKKAFAAKLTSPLAVFVSLARSRAPHSVDARLMFNRMEDLLSETGRSMTGFIKEVDPKGLHSAGFLLRSHAYDSLVPYLTRRPQEARDMVPLLFSNDRVQDIRAHAAPLEGLMVQLAARGRAPASLEAFVQGLRDHALTASPPTARRTAAFLKINQDILPKKHQSLVSSVEDLLSPNLFEDEGLTPPNPRESWPSDQWTFVLHFASTESYNAFLSRFMARGYQAEPSPSGAAVSKKFGDLKVTLAARLYPGDKDGFLRGEQSQRFLREVSENLRDKSVQGVILRNHAQYRIVNLFGKGVTSSKLLIDGACRSAWDLAALRRKCPTCHFIVNTATGYGRLNNDAVIAVIEGLANGDDWDEIGENWSRHSPKSAARMQGPWTPPYEEALKVLEAEEKKGRWVRPAGS